MSRTTVPGNTPPPTPMRRIAIANCTGTTIEFYDFFIHGRAGALLPEMFQTEYHYTGAGMAYAIAGVIGSGTAPILAAELAGRFGGEAVGWMLAAFGALSLICATFLPETRQRVMEKHCEPDPVESPRCLRLRRTTGKTKGETVTKTIDAWMQHPTQRWLDMPFLDSLRRWSHGTIPDTEPPVSWTLDRMDEAGVEIGMLSAWHGPSGALISNDEVGAVVKSHPDRFVMVASADLSRPMDAVHELRRCADEYGAVGLRIIPWLWDLPPDDRRYYPLYAACCDLDITFCTQIGHTGPLCPSEPGRPIPYLDHVALEFPELRIVAGHIGVPWTNEAISLATKYPNVYIDTSAYKSTRYPTEIVDYLRGHGRHKVLFGSNHPAWPASDCLAGLDALDLDETTRAAFLRSNAIRAFKLPY